MVFIIVILVVQCVLMLWTLLPARVNQVMLGMERCVLTLMNVLKVTIFVILVLKCVLMLLGLVPTCLNHVMLGREHCTDTDECADGTHNCHPVPAVSGNAVGSLSCSFKSGYERNATMFVDIEECAYGIHNLALLPDHVNQFMLGM